MTEAVREKCERLAELIGRGYTRASAGRVVGLSERRVYALIKENPWILERAAEIQESYDPQAVDVLRELLSHPDPNIRIKAATALLRAPADEGPATQETVTLIIHRDESFEVQPAGKVPQTETDPEEESVPAFAGGAEFASR